MIYQGDNRQLLQVKNLSKQIELNAYWPSRFNDKLDQSDKNLPSDTVELI